MEFWVSPGARRQARREKKPRPTGLGHDRATDDHLLAVRDCLVTDDDSDPARCALEVDPVVPGRSSGARRASLVVHRTRHGSLPDFAYQTLDAAGGDFVPGARRFPVRKCALHTS